jgi:4-amino-4-deoxy-L-arabinose transferase-like glycosyltransferase
VNSVFGWTGIVFAFLMARRLFGARAAWLAAVLLASMPRYIGESMNNPKDLPFAVLMLAGLYFIVTLAPRYPYLTWTHAAKLTMAIALATGVRAMGLGLIGYTGVALLIAVLASGERSPIRLGATALRLAIIAVAAIVAATAFWPWAQEQPLLRPIQAISTASNFNWGNPSVFFGRDVLATALPWYYLPTWLAMTLPPVVILGAALSLVRLVRRAESRVQLSAIWLFTLVPAALAVVRHLSLYDGIRHMYFIVPPVAVAAAAGWDFALAARPRFQSAVAVVLALGIAEPIVFQIRNHPNQNVYFTPLMGGPRAAYGQFELDYWGNCVLQATRWADGEARRAGIPVGIAANAWEILAVDQPRFPSLWFRRREQDGYHLDVRLLKGQRKAVLDTNASPDVLHRVTMADGTPLCVVMPGPQYPELAERLARVSAPDPVR